MPQNKILLSFDIEEFDLPEEFHAEIPEKEKDQISADGTREILNLLKETDVRATFFITGYFAERHPDMIKEMRDAGHEIASHGMNHSFFEVSHLLQSKNLLEKLSGKEVTGFRMARLAKVDKQEIFNAGYHYESSLNPVWLPGRYHNFRKPLMPFRETCGLLQFPVSAVPFIRFPLFWLSFKNLPLFFYKMLCSITLNRTKYYNMYSHPWEYNEAAKDPRWKIPGYIVKHAGKAQVERLRSLIIFLKKKGDFITFEEYKGSVPNKD